MVIDDALAQGDELGVAHVVLGIIGAPSADDEAPCAVRLEHVIDGGEERAAELVGGLAGLPFVSPRAVIQASREPTSRKTVLATRHLRQGSQEVELSIVARGTHFDFNFPATFLNKLKEMDKLLRKVIASIGIFDLLTKIEKK